MRLRDLPHSGCVGVRVRPKSVSLTSPLHLGKIIMTSEVSRSWWPRALHLLVSGLLLSAHTSTAAYTVDASEPELETSQVEVVLGYNASLPCAIHPPPNDAPALTLWYIGSGEAPVYSYDQRPTSRPNRWSETRVFGERASYLPLEHPPVLHLTNVTTQDAQLYRCRVDYHTSNSRQAWVRLSVIVPPTHIEVVSRMSPVEVGQINDVVSGPGRWSSNVTIEPEEKPLVAGRRANLDCTVIGSNPPPQVTWYQQGQEVEPLRTEVQVGDNITVSVLLLDVTREHHGRQLVCRAQHPTLSDATLEDIYTLDVSFKPNVSLRLGRALNPADLQEGNDIFFDCSVDANPPPYKIRWLHQL
ncbi:cell adhesion molecule 4-like [Homarus americanus]|uniref:cell adhesion molecule 4-like n=1 Tax=Homarus americanus TaxID=6706 RepID=UPI001C470141|nr:cell adhesion molecule 4-like [Homarus americanus]